MKGKKCQSQHVVVAVVVAVVVGGVLKDWIFLQGRKVPLADNLNVKKRKFWVNTVIQSL